MDNPYKPYPVRIDKVIVETEDKNLKSFRLVFLNQEDELAFNHSIGQFAEISLAGYGEMPIGIASSPTEKGHLLFTVNKVGSVSRALHNMKEGATIGVRGPLGNGFPLEEMQGKDIVLVAGGFAVTTIRAAITYMLEPENRSKFGKINFVYGARTPGMLLYKDELEAWSKRDDIETHITIDREAEEWDGLVGMVPNILEEAAPSSSNAKALVCGPPIMIKFTQPVLDKLGFNPEDVYMSLENRMKCGIGICGRCNIGPEYVCLDGPVFSRAQLMELPNEI